MVDSCPREPSYPSRNSGSFYARRGGAGVGWCKLLSIGILCPCNWARWSGTAFLQTSQKTSFVLFSATYCGFSCSVTSDSFQSRDCSPPGSSVHGLSQARILEWGAVSSSGGLPDPGIEPKFPASPALAGGLFTLVPPGKPLPTFTSV